MFEYSLTSEELADLRSRFIAGESIGLITTKGFETKTKSLGTIVRVNDLGEVVVNWGNDDAPLVIVSEKAVKKIDGK